jgi:beta-lactamase regulating signal transducer with metallopeptidase domain
VEATVNWIWQGVALTAVTTLGLHHSPRLSATTKYQLWWVAMVLVLLLPLAPRFATWVQPVVAPGAAAALAPVPLPALPIWPVFAAVGVWLAWVAIALARVMTSFASLLLARRRAAAFPPEREAALPHWNAVRTHGRPARLAVCDGIASAAVFGLGPAIIAVSPATCARLTNEELDQVILHEWAHVQRRDDFSRLAQMAVRVVAGLHPAVWWIGRRLEIERETACDDFAVNVTGAARSLARCLTKLAEGREARRPAVLVPGVLASSQLATRVQRLLDPSRNRSTARARGVLGPIAAALVALAASLSQVELVAAAGPPPLPPPVQASQAGLPQTTAPLRLEPPEAARAVSSPPPQSKAPSSSSGATAPREPVKATAPGDAAPAGSPAPEPMAAVPLPPLARGSWAAPSLPSVTGADGSSGTAGGSPAADTHTPWGAAAEAGISIGRGSQKAASATADAGVSVGHGSTKAAVATAGFFTRLGRKVAGSS